MVDKDGFMVPLEDQKQSAESTKVDSPVENTENMGSPRKRERSPKKETRSVSPKKAIERLSRNKSPEKSARKESMRAKPGDPKHNWRILSDAVGFTAGEEVSAISSLTNDMTLTDMAVNNLQLNVEVKHFSGEGRQ